MIGVFLTHTPAASQNRKGKNKNPGVIIHSGAYKVRHKAERTAKTKPYIVEVQRRGYVTDNFLGWTAAKHAVYSLTYKGKKFDVEWCGNFLPKRTEYNRMVATFRKDIANGLNTKSHMVTSKSKPKHTPLSHAVRHYYAGINEEQTIAEVFGDGKYIKLIDGSLWEVSEVDVVDSALWLATTDVEVIDSDNPLYPYTIINKEDGEKVEAKLIHQ